MKVFETAGFCLVTIAAKRHAADPTCCPLFAPVAHCAADPTFCPLFAPVAHCTVLLAFAFTMDRDMPQALFQAHCLESIIVIVEELLLIR
jgi:hypothetical protein